MARRECTTEHRRRCSRDAAGRHAPLLAVTRDRRRRRSALLRGLFESRLAPELARLVTHGRTGKARLATARALWAQRVPIPVAETLHELARVATPEGRDAFVEAACDLQKDPAGWERASPVDLAAKLLAEKDAQPLLARAHLRLARLPLRRATYGLSSDAPRRVLAERLSALAAGLREEASERGERGARTWSDAWGHMD
jgi:hypothetical protein